MEIRLYNSLTRKIETFKPINEGEVSMYVCGPTVYNYPHIGNMRPVVTFDTLRRFFEYVGYKVTYVSNFTDVDDKIIKAAQAENKTEKELTTYYIKEFQKTIHAMGSLDPHITPKVTDYIEKIIDYIDNLVKLDAAYVVDGDVYFRVSSVKDYGCLSNMSLDDMMVGARIEENSKKESPYDFALWKKTEEGIKWPSPWGLGRPGWHTECCVMIDTIFNGKIDIHGGGYDLKFPHHENEIAQCEATHHHKIANIWMHNAFININNEKMSKSLGNVIYAKDMVERYGGNATRLVILNTHYRMPVNFMDDTIHDAEQTLLKISNAYKQLALYIQKNDMDLDGGEPEYINPILNTLADDLNTANAIAEVLNIMKDINQSLRNPNVEKNHMINLFKSISDALYLLGLNIPYVKLSDEDKNLLKEYDLARKNKDFETSDKLRQILISKGIL